MNTVAKEVLIPFDEPSRAVSTERINDKYSWQVAEIGALFQVIYTEGTVSAKDFDKLQALHHGLCEVRDQVHQLALSPEQKASTMIQLRQAQQLLEDTTLLAQALHEYYAIAAQFDDVEASLVDHSYEPYETNLPLLALEYIEQGISSLVDLWYSASSSENSTLVANRMLNLYESDIRNFSFVLEDWAETVSVAIKNERHILTRWLDSCEDSVERQHIIQQLQALNTQLAEVRKGLRDVSTRLESFAGLLASCPECLEHLATMQQAIKDAMRAITKELGTFAPVSDAPPLVYGSKEWRLLVTQRPQERHSLFQRALGLFTHAADWSDTTKRIVHNLFIGIQLSQQAIGMWNTLGSAKGLADKLQREAIDAVPKEKVEQIERDSSMLGNLLTSKFSELKKSSATFDALTKRHTAIRPALQAVLDSKEVLSPAEISAITDTYRLLNLVAASPKGSPYTHLSIQDWWNLLTESEETAPVPKAEQLLLSNGESTPVVVKSNGFVSQIMSWIGGFWKATQTIPAGQAGGFFEAKTREIKEQLKEGLSASAQLNRTVSIYPELDELRAEVALLHHALLSTARNAPDATSPLVKLASWSQEVYNKCYAIEALEQSVSMLMDRSRSALNVDDAELEKFGHKHMNNVKQRRVAQALQVPGVIVPLSQGLTSDAVHSFLRSEAPEVFEHWEALAQLYKEKREDTLFLEQSTAKEHLEAIDAAISSAFGKEGSYNSLKLTPEFLAWLEEVRVAGDYLMVRSTGSEDTRQLANAGGNVSETYISPDPHSFCKSAGEVVRSYFGYGSLQNRINANQNPFKQELKLAVTAQQLIGEPIGGSRDPQQIPISLVLFTDEPLYSGGESFRVMRISASYGHGEGVVGNLGIATDTVTLLVSDAHPDELYILYDNQSKPYRLAPARTAEGIHLDKVLNPPELKDRPALNSEMLARLYHWGIIGEKFFDGAATDMEIVIKGDTIYPVQARPVNRLPMLPTYLDMRKIADLNASPIIQKVQAESLVPGKASVVEIRDSKQILQATTLALAEKAFNPEIHKLVIVSQTEPANSHPVVNFSGLGTPCLVAKDTAVVDKLVSQISADRPLAVCMQTAALHQWDASKGDIAAFTSHGFAVHPAKIAISLPIRQGLSKAGIPPQVPQEIKDFILAIRAATTKKVALEKLEELTQHPWVQGIQTGRQGLVDQLKDRNIVAREASNALAVINSFDIRLTQAFNETKAAIRRQETGQRLKPLLQVKVLETLLVGASQAAAGIGQYSIRDITPAIEHAQEIIDYQNALSHSAHFADILLVGHQALTPEGTQQWTQFLRQLEPLVEQGVISDEQVKGFKSLVNTLQQANALPDWLTFTFPSAIKNNASPQNVLEALIASLPPEDFAFVRQQLDKLKGLSGLKDHIDRFASPESFEKAWQELQDYASQEAQVMLSQQMRDASPTARSIALKTMKELVDIFDVAIKTLKASAEWEDTKKVPQFKQMLIPYLGLLQSWHNTDLVKAGSILVHASWPIQTYLAQMNKLLSGLKDVGISQTRPSNNFSVAAGVLGTKTAFDRHFPNTLEDMFTLIHQNLLVVIANINNNLYSTDAIGNSALPESLKMALNLISSRYPDRVGFEISQDDVEVIFNVPLRNHSGQLVLIYDKQEDKLTLKSQLLGEARGRWPKLAGIVQILSDIDVLPITEPIYQAGQELTMVWDVSAQNSVQAVLKAYEEMGKYSNGEISERGLGKGIFFLHQESERLDALLESSVLFTYEVGSGILQQAWMSGAIDKRGVARAFHSSDPKKQMFDWMVLETFGWAVLELGANNLSWTPALELMLEAGVRQSFSDAGVARTAAKALTVLVNSGYGYKMALEAAPQILHILGEGESLEAVALLGAFLDRDIGAEFVVQVTKRFPNILGELDSSEALRLLITFIDRGIGVDFVTQVAQRLIESKNSKGCELLYSLVTHDYIPEGTVEMVTTVIMNFTAFNQVFISEEPTKGTWVSISYELIKKGIGLKAFEAVVLKGFTHPVHDPKWTFAMQVLIFLVKQGEYQEVALKVVQQRDEDTVRMVAKAITALVIDGHGYKVALEAVPKILDILGENAEALALLYALADRGIGNDFVAQVSQRLVKSGNPNGCGLLYSLVTHDYIPEGVVETVKAEMMNASSVKWVDIAVELMKRGVGLKAFEAFAKESLTYPVQDVDWGLVIPLLSYFIDQGDSQEIALKTLQHLLDHDCLYNSNDLLIELMERGLGYEIAINAVKRDMQSVVSIERLVIINICLALVEKQQATDLAQDIVKQGLLDQSRSVRLAAQRLEEALSSR